MLAPLRKVDPEWYAFEWIDLLTFTRQADFRYEAGAVVRPPGTEPAGIVLECTQAGWTRRHCPTIPRAVGQVFMDGTVEWTVRHPDTAAAPTPASATYSISPSGVVQASASIDTAGRRTLVRLDAGAASPGEYEILAIMVDSNGEQHSAEDTFEVIE